MKLHTLKILKKVKEACLDMIEEYSSSLKTAIDNPSEFTKEEVATLSQRHKEARNRYSEARECIEWVESL